MTTIAFRAGDGRCVPGMVAADTGVTSQGARFAAMRKILRNGAGDVAAVCGDCGWAASFLKWFEDGEKGDSPQITSRDGAMIGKGVVFRACGRIDVFEEHGRYNVTASYYAMGSGRDVALGAMYAGMRPADAIRAAIAHDESTWGDVTELWTVRQ